MVLAFGLGVFAGIVRWRRPYVTTSNQLQAARELARPPGVTALRDARPAAVVDLMTPDGLSLVTGRWRATTEARLFRIDLTIPERLAGFETRGSSLLFEVAVDGYAQASVNGARALVLGENGDWLLARGRARNRIVVTRDVRPGEHIELAILGVAVTPSAPRGGPFSIRSATLDFIAAPPNPKPIGEIVRLDPALDGVVSANARLEKIAGGFQFVEGPTWMPSGFLLFSDFAANLIYRWSPDDGVTVFRTKSGHAGADIGDFSIPGSNGLTVDREGRLTIAEHGRRRIVRLEPDGRITVLADTYEGRRLNSPNDLVYKSDGALYFTDPPFGLPRPAQDPRRELPYSGVFRWHNGRLDLLTSDLGGPNGLAFSDDERYLYVTDWGLKPAIWRFDVNADGTIAHGRVFFPGAIDGIKVDQRGNVYAAAQEGVAWIISPEGKALGMIKPPSGPSNLAWGDADRRTLYVTGGTVVYRIRGEVPGSGVWPEPGRRLTERNGSRQEPSEARPLPTSGFPPSR
jgi:gluconolactonase